MMKGKDFQSDDSDEDFADDHHDVRYASHTGSCQRVPGRRLDRKKRRGIIEKRRRDRINGSLSELKRLVPSAFEKQGSTKLEKAEILQLTVDHLQMLNAKGLNGYGGTDSSTVALDYRSFGFRECVAETARYLLAVEGMDMQDPMRMRLLGHLEAYSAQRDVTAKAANMQGLGSLSAAGWPGINSGNTTSALAPHNKYTYGFPSSKSGLVGQFGLLGSTTATAGQNGAVVEGAYLAASRLGSAINGLTSSTTSSSNVGLAQMMPAIAAQQQAGSCHFPVSSTTFSPRYINPAAAATTQLAGLGSTGAHHHQMKHMRNFAPDLAY